MRAILISIKPRWLTKILNGEKTIEVRKSKPKCNLPIDVYIYCTTTGKVLYEQFDKCVDGKIVGIHWNTDENEGGFYGFNGRVVAKFTLNRVEEIGLIKEVINLHYTGKRFIMNKIGENIYDVSSETLRNSCLTYEEISKYLKGKKGYAWYISNLVIFDKPRELGEFKRCTEKTCIYGKCHKYMHCLKPLTKAPQDYQFIEVGGEQK